jgi:thioredoxin
MVDELKEIRARKIQKMLAKMRIAKMETIIEVNDIDFQEKVLEMSKKVPVVVDFWAQWCGPCMALGPSLEKLAEEYDGKFILAKINVEDNPNASRTFMIRSIPAVKMFKNGEVAAEFVGMRHEDDVRKWLEDSIGD